VRHQNLRITPQSSDQSAYTSSLVSAWGLAELVRGFLFEIQPHDPTIYAGVLAVLTMTGLAARSSQLAARLLSIL
jgi:hypothetical protein